MLSYHFFYHLRDKSSYSCMLSSFNVTTCSTYCTSPPNVSQSRLILLHICHKSLADTFLLPPSVYCGQILYIPAVFVTHTGKTKS